MIKVRNKSDQIQHFTGIGTWAVGETIPVSEEQAEYLSHSPHMEILGTLRGVEKDESKEENKAPKLSKSIKGIEKES